MTVGENVFANRYLQRRCSSYYHQQPSCDYGNTIKSMHKKGQSWENCKELIAFLDLNGWKPKPLLDFVMSQ